MAIILFVIYGAMAILQAAAIYSLGYEVFDLDKGLSIVSALALAVIPLLGSLLAAYGAFMTWHLSAMTAGLIFVLPGIMLILFAIPEIIQVRKTHRLT